MSAFVSFSFLSESLTGLFADLNTHPETGLSENNYLKHRHSQACRLQEQIFISFQALHLGTFLRTSYN